MKGLPSHFGNRVSVRGIFEREGNKSRARRCDVNSQQKKGDRDLPLSHPWQDLSSSSAPQTAPPLLRLGASTPAEVQRGETRLWDSCEVCVQALTAGIKCYYHLSILLCLMSSKKKIYHPCSPRAPTFDNLIIIKKKKSAVEDLYLLDIYHNVPLQTVTGELQKESRNPQPQCWLHISLVMCHMDVLSQPKLWFSLESGHSVSLYNIPSIWCHRTHSKMWLVLWSTMQSKHILLQYAI